MSLLGFTSQIKLFFSKSDSSGKIDEYDKLLDRIEEKMKQLRQTVEDIYKRKI